MNINYQQKMEEILTLLPKNKKPSLLLHVCCAPCSSYVLSILSSYFNITIYYYNPNISPYKEFIKRAKEIQKLLLQMSLPSNVEILIGDYENSLFENTIDAYRHDGEGSFRCFSCYRLRLESTCKKAKEKNFDYFTTTLSISPYKNSKVLNQIGEQLSKKYHISYLYADFKKKDGYKKSIEFSKLYNLYRQDYCGCIYSKMEKRYKQKDIKV